VRVWQEQPVSTSTKHVHKECKEGNKCLILLSCFQEILIYYDKVIYLPYRTYSLWVGNVRLILYVPIQAAYLTYFLPRTSANCYNFGMVTVVTWLYSDLFDRNLNLHFWYLLILFLPNELWFSTGIDSYYRNLPV